MSYKDRDVDLYNAQACACLRRECWTCWPRLEAHAAACSGCTHTPRQAARMGRTLIARRRGRR